MRRPSTDNIATRNQTHHYQHEQNNRIKYASFFYITFETWTENWISWLEIFVVTLQPNDLQWTNVQQPVCCHKVSGVPQIFIRNCIFAFYSWKKIIFSVFRIHNTHTQWFIIDSFIQHVLSYVFICLHTYSARIYMWYIFMAMCRFVPPFREAKFCGVPSCVFDNLGCAVDEKKVPEHWYRRQCLPPISLQTHVHNNSLSFAAKQPPQMIQPCQIADEHNKIHTR
jgi:hypothetical protein